MTTAKPRQPQSTPAHWRHDILSADEEHALAVRARAGDTAARDRLILANQRLVVSIAKKHKRGDHDLMDLVSIGNWGLIRAVEMFELDRQVRFSTYASRRISAAIQREVINTGYTVRLSVWVETLRRRFHRAELQLAASGTEPPKFEAVCRAIGVTPKTRDSLADAIKVRRAEYETGLATEQLQAREEPGTSTGNDDDCRRAIAVLLQRLTPRQRRVVELHYGLTGDEPLSLREIARRLGWSSPNASDAHDRAMANLRLLTDKRHEALIA